MKYRNFRTLSICLIAVSLFFCKQATEPTPDKPVPFGYKCIWILVSASNPTEIKDFLSLKNARKSNWKEGIKNAYDSGFFISPVVKGRIFIISVNLPGTSFTKGISRVKNLLGKLSKRFGDVQFFGTHRIVEYHSWAHYQKGNLVRGFSYIGESGAILWNEGKLTPVEKELKYFLAHKNFTGDEKPDIFSSEIPAISPNENMVMKIADSWGLSPVLLGEIKEVTGLGYIGSSIKY